jgi:phosphohistidine phosphatase
MTILYLVRHGVAEDAADGQPDAERELTDKGRKKFRKAAKGLVRVSGKRGVAHILTSPLVRARQTAEILAAVIDKHGGKVDVAVLPGLGDKPDLEEVVDAARGVKRSDDEEVGVAAVGHEPTLSDWIGDLCFQKRGAVALEKGGVAAIRLSGTGLKGELLWLAGPELLREV